MKIVILANTYAGFVRPLAEGLASMLEGLGEQAAVLYDGLNFLHMSGEHIPAGKKMSAWFLKDAAKAVLNTVFRTQYPMRGLPLLWSKPSLRRTLLDSDLVIVVEHMPNAFLAERLSGIESLRREESVPPMVLYDMVHIATRGPWMRRILNEYPAPGGRGLERYDWYLAGSVVSEYRMPEGFKAFDVIGMDLRHQSLHPGDKGEFLALLDFPRPGFERFRRVQIEALEETGTDYLVLDRPMHMEQIRSLYRRTGLFFLSFRESFGLPIVELQLCGSCIALPFRNWAPSHYIGKSIRDKGEGRLGRNFIVYDNDKEKLKVEISRLREAFDPAGVVEEFKGRHPHLHHGDRTALKRFLHRIRSGEVTSHTHESHAEYNDKIIPEL